jgi:hypothetical protein
MVTITIPAHEVAELLRDKLKEKYNFEIPDKPIHDGGWLCDSLTAISYSLKGKDKYAKIDALSFDIEIEDEESS